MNKSQPSASYTNVSGFAFTTADYQTEEKDKLRFFIDSATSHHLINDDSILSNSTVLNPPVKLALAKEGMFITTTKRGSNNVISNLGILGTLDVFYSAELPNHLLSVIRLQQAGMNIIFKKNGAVEIQKNGKVIVTGSPFNNLVCIDFNLKTEEMITNIKIFNVMNNDYDFWHQRLDHISKRKFLEWKNKQMTEDIKIIDNISPDDKLCEACINGKQAWLHLKKEKGKNHIKRPLFVVHTDVYGPITPLTFNDKNYFIIFVDQFTH